MIDPRMVRHLADAARADLNATVTIDAAESVVRRTRLADLTDAHRAADRRVAAARGQVTRARKTGAAEKVTAAEEKLRERQADADTAYRALMSEGTAIVRTGFAAADQMVDDMREAWAADDAATAVERIQRETP